MIRVLALFSQYDEWFMPDHRDLALYNFANSLNKHPKMEVRLYAHSGTIPLDALVKEYDVIFLLSLDYSAVCALRNLPENRIPVVARMGDPHVATALPMFDWLKKCRVVHGVEKFPLSCIRMYYPESVLKDYTMIQYGIEPNLFDDCVIPWEERIANEVAISGVMPLKSLRGRFAESLIQKKDFRLSYHYKLRAKCMELDHVVNVTQLSKQMRSSDFPTLLGNYRAAIAAASWYPVIKYYETPASGCLTFMEVTEQNHCAEIGYEDEMNAVFINKDNYKKKIREYLKTPHDPKWKDIAKAGKEHTLKNLNNKKATDKLFTILQEVSQRGNVSLPPQ